MREILFRGKRIDNGEWVKGLPYKAKYGSISAIATADEEIVMVIPETISQFTGLYDRYGNKVFEGDIIAYKYKTNPYLNTFTIGHCIVEYIETLGVYSPFGDSGLALEANEIEVVGNIHDCPELLKD